MAIQDRTRLIDLLLNFKYEKSFQFMLEGFFFIDFQMLVLIFCLFIYKIFYVEFEIHIGEKV